jgi:hypothetical protein
MLLGHPIDLKAKAGGERSMSEKQGSLEDAEGAALQAPRDRAKAALPESQSPAVQQSHLLLRRLQRSATRDGLFKFRDRPPPTGGAMKNDFIEGDEWDAYVALDTFSTNGTRDRLRDASPRATESPQ